MATTMTKKAFFTTIVNSNLDAEVKQFAQKMLDTEVKASEQKSKASAEKRAKTNAPKLAIINEYLSKCTVPQLLTDIAKATELSVPTISGLSREQCELGNWLKGTKAVKGKGKQTTLCLATVVESEPESDDSDSEDSTDEPMWY